MKKPKRISLDHGERIIAVVPEYCAGPGWSNSVVWVYIRTHDGALREKCIQPEERTAEMSALFEIGAAVAQSLLQAVPVKRQKETP